MRSASKACVATLSIAATALIVPTMFSPSAAEQLARGAVDPPRAEVAPPSQDSLPGRSVVMLDPRLGSEARVFGTRVLAHGAVDLDWVADSASTPMRFSWASIRSAEVHGGTCYVWTDQSGAASRVHWRIVPSSGSLDASRSGLIGADGVGQQQPDVAEDGNGGVFIAWTDFGDGEGNIRAQRLDAEGKVAESWPHEGLVVGGASRRFVLGHHPAHHNFRTGLLTGRRTHLQLDTFVKGEKGSHQNLFRIPFGR